VERLTGGRQEAGHRPATLPGDGLGRLHVDGVDVGAFFAVDLDVDEVGVHHRCDVRILEGLMRHHVAPVAGGIADGQQYRDAPPGRLRERLLAPRPPVDRVGGMLQ
jgi:hypothetical protein